LSGVTSKLWDRGILWFVIKPAPSLWRDLTLGMVGHDVAAWQAVQRTETRPPDWSAFAAWPIAVDGSFGHNTEQATKTFRTRRGLSGIGIVDAATRALVDPTLFIEPVPVPATGLPPIAFIQARDWQWANRTVVDLIVLHSAEVGEYHSSAEGVAAYFKMGPPEPASSGYVVDDDSIVQCVKDEHIAWHAPGVNPRSIGIEQAGYAKQTRDEWLDPYGQRMLALVAKLVAAKARQFNIPLVWLTPADILAGKRGLCEHIDVTHAYPHLGTHVDCGPGYPKDIVLAQALAA